MLASFSKVVSFKKVYFYAFDIWRKQRWRIEAHALLQWKRRAGCTLQHIYNECTEVIPWKQSLQVRYRSQSGQPKRISLSGAPVCYPNCRNNISWITCCPLLVWGALIFNGSLGILFIMCPVPILARKENLWLSYSGDIWSLILSSQNLWHSTCTDLIPFGLCINHYWSEMTWILFLCSWINHTSLKKALIHLSHGHGRPNPENGEARPLSEISMCRRVLT